MFSRIAEFHDWFEQEHTAHSFRVTVAPLDSLEGWSIDPETSAITHRSGKFFTIDGLEVQTNHGLVESWSQPIIDQPESGILGILVRRFGGVPHFLMQAKMEPGNINLLQLSPTVQATKSNYTRVHGGRSVPYLEYFMAPRRSRVLSDVLQSEQGAWFLHKRNRNMIIEVTEDVPLRPGFCWLTRDQLGALLKVDNLVNMDSRTVLAGYPFSEHDGSPERPVSARDGGFHQLLAGYEGRPVTMSHRDIAEPLSWFTEVKTRYDLRRRRVPLNQVKNWICGPDRITHELGRYFSVIGVHVEAGSREVSRWSQPLLAPVGQGVVAFLLRRHRGEHQLLVQARTQAGTFDVVEMAPTVQCSPDNYRGLPEHRRPPFLDHVLAAPRRRIRFDVVHSEEGGRFYHATNRYLIVEVDDDFPTVDRPDFTWMTIPQLAELARYGNYVNVEARNLLACLRFHSEPSEDGEGAGVDPHTERVTHANDHAGLGLST
ncbi:NDP-hexose 2,3-dehydratase family protein [Micromonospora sp. KC723]|uniref:NDP-hexose 2,3-dehydratase family protein n=1 Tax=Micromonospora sp. KC723 TaxID=2530381 RepID=UPI0010498F2E|nr:NDP-hexose 2,3-dehydratase family protein [Micromonospora sp. KC723]TDB78121.1 NDP-hexose 2,3-dehydratase [Micromonospora sp. KC723]